MGMGQYLWRHQAELFTPLQGQRTPHLSTLDCARFFIGGGHPAAWNSGGETWSAPNHPRLQSAWWMWFRQKMLFTSTLADVAADSFVFHRVLVITGLMFCYTAVWHLACEILQNDFQQAGPKESCLYVAPCHSTRNETVWCLTKFCSYVSFISPFEPFPYSLGSESLVWLVVLGKAVLFSPSSHLGRWS